MIFNQTEFLFVFLPLTLAAFFAPGLRGMRPYTLLIASLVFYGVSGIEHAVVLAIEVAWVYALTRLARAPGSRLLLTCAVLPPALGLLYYKYLGFVVRTLIGAGISADETFSLFKATLLPAGISFFTFNLISFAIDRYRGEIPAMPPFRRFALFIMFFPHLVAGPILRYRDVAERLARLKEFTLKNGEAATAIGYICLGLAAKVLVADTLGRIIDPMAHAPGALPPAGAAYVMFAYSFQIYFDFYGYSLVAIGLALLFGIRFPRNFARPYEARNPRDFWRRWHMTLSYWIRDYLYLPLGGNARYVRNILIVFALCGLWHGAGWNFVVWGLYHAGLVIAYHFGRSGWDRLPNLAQIAATFVLVSLGWTLFLFDFDGAQALIQSLFGLGAASAPAPTAEHWALLLLAALACFAVYPEAMAERKTPRAAADYARTAAFAVLFVATLLFLDRSQDFIYFRF